MEKIFDFGNVLMAFMNGLDWSYIITFILSAWLLLRICKPLFFIRIFGLRLRKSFVVLLTGFLVAVIWMYFDNGLQSKKYIKTLFQSYLFGQICHQFFLKDLEKKLEKFLAKRLDNFF